jgi:hypothetical protein
MVDVLLPDEQCEIDVVVGGQLPGLGKSVA